MAKILYVGNLNYDTTQDGLRDFFSKVGVVVSVSIITDRMSGRSRGFGFVEVVDENTAQEAVRQLDGRELDGRSLKVAEAKPRQRRDDWIGDGRTR